MNSMYKSVLTIEFWPRTSGTVAIDQIITFIIKNDSDFILTNDGHFIIENKEGT